MNLRIAHLREKLRQSGLDCLIVSNSANISYLTKYRSRGSYLLVSEKQNIYFTDSCYFEEARQALRGAVTLKKIEGAPLALIADTCAGLKARKVAFEERATTFAAYAGLKKQLKRNSRLIPARNLVEDLRKIKEPEELAKIKKAIRITKEALNFIKRFIKQGRRELEVAAELERFIRYQGATNAAFDIIVASGPNSAFAHHVSSARKIRDNEPVLIDIGVDYEGYKSDLTRIFFLGKINVLAQKVADIVLEAQARAVACIRPGIAAQEVDAASRSYIAEQGYGGYFGHGLGHGVGLEIHEAPTLSSKSQAVLMPGMVCTIEPAVYLPGKFGLRLEDMVVVTKKGCEVLSGALN